MIKFLSLLENLLNIQRPSPPQHRKINGINYYSKSLDTILEYDDEEYDDEEYDDEEYDDEEYDDEEYDDEEYDDEEYDDEEEGGGFYDGEPDDEIEVINLNITQIITSKRAVFNTLNDLKHGDFSKSGDNNLEVWKDNGEYYLTDGYHRFVENLITNKKDIFNCQVIGEGYSDYHMLEKDKSKRFIVKNKLKFKGLEELYSVQTLQQIKENLI